MQMHIMRVSKEELTNYLGNDLASLEGKLKIQTIRKLGAYEERIKFGEASHFRERPPSVIDYLFLAHQKEGINIKRLAKDLEISAVTLRTIFSIYGLPLLTQSEAAKRKWEDPEYKERGAERMRKTWEDPEYKERQLNRIRRQHADPEFREKRAEGIKRVWENPEYREIRSDRMKRQIMDPEFRERLAEGVRKKWQDPGYKEKHAEAMRKRWQDPEYRERHAQAIKRSASRVWADLGFRERNAEGTRRARSDPKNAGKYYLPTFKGYRKDIAFHAQSSWEANFARVLMYCGREFLTGETFRLQVPQDSRHLFVSNVTEMHVDFVSLDSRGNPLIYEIMAHPLENPVGFAKLEMLIQQYPVSVRVIDPPFYERLKKRFEDKINSTSFLSGWETGKDNLKTNPQKYA